MPHAYNQRIFAGPDLTSPVLRAYLSLVAIELALKNHASTNWSSGHDVPLMITGFGDASLNGLVAQLRITLEALWCEKKGGGSARLSSGNYPAIRYIRHHTDHPFHASSDADIIAVLDAVTSLRAELGRKGVI